MGVNLMAKGWSHVEGGAGIVIGTEERRESVKLFRLV